MSIVYFVQPTDGGPFRVGATLDVATRVISIGSWHPNGVEVMAAIPGHYLREASVHAVLRPYHLRRDWFRSCPALWSIILDAQTTGLPWLPGEPEDDFWKTERKGLRSRVAAAFASEREFLDAAGIASVGALSGFYDCGQKPSARLYGALIAREVELQGKLPSYLQRQLPAEPARRPSTAPTQPTGAL